jgi:CTD small phosphatase-like protein 2
LKEASADWEIVVFTAALKDYANWILNSFDNQKYISRRLYRDSCTLRRGVYLKDLLKVGTDLSKIVIVDNLPENFQLQPNNGIAIKSWFNDNT